MGVRPTGFRCRPRGTRGLRVNLGTDHPRYKDFRRWAGGAAAPARRPAPPGVRHRSRTAGPAAVYRACRGRRHRNRAEAGVGGQGPATRRAGPARAVVDPRARSPTTRCATSSSTPSSSTAAAWPWWTPAGTPTRPGGPSRGLAAAGGSIADVRAVLVTHIHPDHYGLAGRVREASGAWIGLHPDDAVMLESRYGDTDALARRHVPLPGRLRRARRQAARPGLRVDGR